MVAVSQPEADIERLVQHCNDTKRCVQPSLPVYFTFFYKFSIESLQQICIGKKRTRKALVSFVVTFCPREIVSFHRALPLRALHFFLYVSLTWQHLWCCTPIILTIYLFFSLVIGSVCVSFLISTAILFPRKGKRQKNQSATQFTRLHFTCNENSTNTEQNENLGIFFRIIKKEDAPTYYGWRCTCAPPHCFHHTNAFFITRLGKKERC